jgi:Mlc titration factor MtfA (ptsG expression regulator)
MKRWLRRLGGLRSSPPRIDDNVWERLLRRVPEVRELPHEHQARLRQFAERFLADKAISAAADFELDDERRLILAVTCCLPVLHLGYDWLAGWHELIVYPGEFGVRRHDYDEATGVMSEWDDALVGEAWDRGPMILSWAEVEMDLTEPTAGYHVVAHEIAHKLDALDGHMDGTPPLPAARRAAWIATFQAAYDALCADVEAGREPAIDAYGAEAPDEFFAVASEYHFTDPAYLRNVLPDVAAQLATFYGAPAPSDSGTARPRMSQWPKAGE